MTLTDVLAIFGDALWLVVVVVALLVVPSLVVGLIVSIFQAATQINEQTLSFLPRLLVTLGSIMALGPWILNEFVDHFLQLFQAIPLLIG